MRHWLLIGVLCSSAFGQAPTLVQSALDNGVTVGSGVTNGFAATNGNLLFAVSISGAASVTDTLSNSWTVGTPNLNVNNSTNAFWTLGASSGNDAVTPNTGGLIQALEFSGLSTTLDGTCFNNTAVGLTSISCAVTTTMNGDVIVACASTVDSAGNIYPTSAAQFATYRHGSGALACEWIQTGAAGTYTPAFTIDTSPSQQTMAVYAFKPTAALITSQKLADATNGASYSYTLKEVGLVGAETWSITSGSLQTGLSLNTSTGAITGTPSVTSDNTITFHVVGATSGSASKTLTLHVGTVFSTITVVQTGALTAPGAGFTFGSNVTAGHCLVLSMYGYGRHQSQYAGGYVTPDSAISDNLSTIFHRASTITGSIQAGNAVWIGAVNNSGADSISFGAIGDGSGLNIHGAEISGMQCDANDVGAFATGASTSTGTIAITTTLPNELVYANIATQGPQGFPNGGGDTLTPGSSLSSIKNSATWGTYDTSTKTAVTPGSFNASYTTITPSDYWSLGVVGLLPSTSGSSLTGVHHKAQLY